MCKWHCRISSWKLDDFDIKFVKFANRHCKKIQAELGDCRKLHEIKISGG